MVSPPADNSTNEASAQCLVLVSDTSTEAERLIASLRVRGFKVRDVPLMLLPGRVEAQRPKLVICDGEALRVADAISKMRQGAWGKEVELLLLGLDARVTQSLRSMLPDIDARVFARPIDVYSVLQRVEEVIGHRDDGARSGSLSMAALPRVGAALMPGAARVPTPIPRRSRAVNSLSPQRLDSMAAAARGDPPEPSSPKLPSMLPPSEPSAPDSALQAVPVARMSPELEQLLNDADRRLAIGPPSIQPVSVHGGRLSPEQELDAILPPDVLAALDDPVDLDDDDETSHPAARHSRERSAPNGPRGTPVSTVDPTYHVRDDANDHATGATSTAEDDTPVGRPLARGRFATASGGSEPPGGGLPGSVLTPVPASVKTHHTHHTQANSSPHAASAELQERASEREQGAREGQSSTHHDLERRRRSDGDSVVPGTNPEVEGAVARLGAGADASSERDASSTTPPHARRGVGRSVGQPWESTDAGAIASRREYVATDEPPEMSAARSPDVQAPSTNPPANARGRVRTANPQSEASEQAPPDRGRVAPSAEAATPERLGVEVPAALGPGDVVRALSRCVRSRYSGALAIEDESGIRRIVMREGDFVMVASGVDGESLVAFLIQRGDLDPDAARLARKLPQFGRHAGAALIAHGYLRQDELWPVLRAHAEWLLGRAINVSQGSAGLEVELPARLSAEPAVFGGATGAEILIEVVRRIVPPELAVETLGGPRVRLTRGTMSRLLSECALPSAEAQQVDRAASGLTLGELVTQAQNNDFASALYALVELGVLETMAANPESVRDPRQPPPRDGLDDAAVRHRVGLRRSLVDEGDYFALLGISRDATGYEVRHAYLDLRREFEPGRLLTASTADLREDVDLVIEVLDEAYEILRDAARRERYRRALEAPPSC